MTFWQAIFRLFDRWLAPDPDPPPLTSPLRTTAADPTLTVAIYQTDRLPTRDPERSLARHVRDALMLAGYHARITFGHDPIPGDYYPADGEALARWSSACPETGDKHVLLHAGRGGGIAYIGGRYALAPGGLIDAALPVRTTANREHAAYRNVRAGLHELGHTLGGRHADGMIPAPFLTYQGTGWMDSPAP